MINKISSSEKIKNSEISKSLVSFLVYGSCLTKADPSDTDICVVVKNDQNDYSKILHFICENFKNPDVTIYKELEVHSGLPFSDIGNGTFSLEYLSRAVILFGNNPFIDKLSKTQRKLIKQSQLEKLYQYILKIRIYGFSKTFSTKEKEIYLNKYVTRLIRMFLLYSGALTYDNIDSFSRTQLLGLGQLQGLFSRKIKIADYIPYSVYIRIFSNLEISYLKIEKPLQNLLLQKDFIYMRTLKSFQGNIFYFLGGIYAVSDDDIKQLIKICNEGVLYDALFKYRLRGGEYTQENALSFLNWFKEGWRKSSYFAFVIRDTEGILCGSCEIKTDNKEEAEIGYWVMDNCSGVMSNAVRHMISFAFELGYKKLTARVKEGNSRSTLLLSGLGFVLEKSYRRKDGIHESLYSLNLMSKEIHV